MMTQTELEARLLAVETATIQIGVSRMFFIVVYLLYFFVSFTRVQSRGSL
jgi:hypothetical protein